MDTNKLIKILGVTSTILSVGSTILSNWTEEQKMNNKIEEKVSEILSKKLTELNK